jgi:hypothetical protein
MAVVKKLVGAGGEAERRFRLYIDESGDHTFNELEKRDRRYLALLGLWFDTGAPYLRFVAKLQELKDEIFGPHPDNPVILHREDIIKRRGPFFRLRDPNVAERFDSGLLEVVKNGQFSMCCVVIDKLSHEQKTYRTLYHPYHYCLAALLERYVGLLNRRNVKGDVLAESRGRVEDQQLKEAFGHVYAEGTQYQPASMFQTVLTSREIKLKKKTHCIAGLELADILANPIRRLIVAERCGESVPADFGSRLTDIAKSKFNCNLYTGQQVHGYGKVWLT